SAEEGFAGTDRLEYTVKDGNGALSNRGGVSVIVNRPTANDDAGSTTDGQPVLIDLLANDTDPDGNQFLDPTSEQFGQGKHGTVAVNCSGIATYTPSGHFTGVDTFQYSVADTPGARSNLATVRISVEFAPGKQVFVTGAGAGGSPQVNIYNADGTL